jgi:hypothetical protein
MSAIIPIILFSIPVYLLFRRIDHHTQILKDSEEEK